MSNTARALSRLWRLFGTYGPASAAKKLELLAVLERGRLPTARAVRKLHEVLCFLRAYPDDRALLAQVERMLRAFERRADLRRHHAALRDSGIAGTAIHFPFFARAARRLAENWPEQLSIDWDSFDNASRLQRLLPLLTLPAERAAFEEPLLEPEPWLRRFKGGRGRDTDAAFILTNWHALAAAEPVRSAFYDDLDPALCLAPGPDTPARTREKYDGLPVVYQTEPLSRARPDLRSELARPPRSTRSVSAREGQALIDLARNTMLPRERDLEVFAYGNARDVQLIDAGDGLWFACIGVLPERRSLLEAVYGFLMLKNGVAVGYALCSALFGSSEVAYNVFETFRGGETARIFGRLLATIHRLFGSNAFSIDPYQLGHGNEEGLRSGAFWFYQKLGFRPRKREVVRVMNRELSRMQARPAHRSSRATLSVLASAYVFWAPGTKRPDVLGALSLPNVALHVSRYLARRFGADRQRARETCMEEAAAHLDLGTSTLRTAAEREAWARWAPLVMILPRVQAWSAKEKRALIEVIRAKAATHESDFVPLFDGHRRLRDAVQTLAQDKLN